jgi:hypothetical protein
MPDKKTSEVSKKGQDKEKASHLRDLSLGLLKENIGTPEYDVQV